MLEPAIVHAVTIDFERCYRAVQVKDPRFDGWFFTAVTSTGIFCRPSCPARTPKPSNVRFYSTAAAAQDAGFRACKRCRPDAVPGSPQWDRSVDLVGRVMRMIGDGVVDREGVKGLARRVGFAERHVRRELVAAVGVGPLALARARRTQTARLLLETTDLSITDVAFAAGFSSVRQFNATIQEMFAATPTELRRPARDGRSARTSESIVLRLPYRVPLDADGLIAFLALRVVPHVEEHVDGVYRRSLRLPHGAGVVELCPADGYIAAAFHLDDLRDLGSAVQRCRQLLDLDSDPLAIDEWLARDSILGGQVQRSPGKRVPGHVDGAELAVRAVLGQQVSLAGAAALAGRLVETYGEPLKRPLSGVTHLFPAPDTLATADPSRLAMPASRRRALLGLAAALAGGEVSLDEGVERADAQQKLLSLPGIGEWTVAYITMRALRDPDAFLPTDLGVRHALERLGHDGRPRAASRLGERWRPYRAYAVQHLWAHYASAAHANRSKPASRTTDERLVRPPSRRQGTAHALSDHTRPLFASGKPDR
jgi:AraC family transcriptional regulator, regulatory protein of adaptative response / DNA-3-methyladenine glycosylase II